MRRLKVSLNDLQKANRVQQQLCTFGHSREVVYCFRHFYRLLQNYNPIQKRMKVGKTKTIFVHVDHFLVISLNRLQQQLWNESNLFAVVDEATQLGQSVQPYLL